MNQSHNQYFKAKRAGMSTLDIAKMQEIARKESEKSQGEAIEKGLVIALTFVANVLTEDYWKKTAKDKVPDVISKTLSLYKSFIEGAVEYEDCIAYLKEYCGTTIECEWAKGGGNPELVKQLRGVT